MNNRKRILSILLAVCMLVSYIPIVTVTAYAADPAAVMDSTSGDNIGAEGSSISWALSVPDENGHYTKLTISGSGAMKDFSADLTSSDSPWRQGRYEETTTYGDHTRFCNYITTVVVEEGVTTLGNNAFYFEAKLTSASLPSTLSSIGERSFQGCESLENITIPDAVSEIKASAFDECIALENVVLPSGLTSLGNFAFSQNDSLEAITLTEGLTTMGTHVFANCTSLETITLPSTLQTMGEGCFSECTALKEIKVADGNAAFEDEDGILFDKDKEEIIAYPAAKRGDSYVIPGTVKRIGDRAFSDNANLQTITFPAALETIGYSVFTGVKNLKAFVVDQDNQNFASDDGMLYNAAKNTLIMCPPKKAITSYTAPNTLTAINSGAFYQNTYLREVTIGDNISYLGGGTFNGCAALKKATLGSATIGSAFSGNSALKELTLLDTVQTIEGGAFAGCAGIGEVVIPDNVTNLYSGAFSNCSGLKKVTIGNGVASMNPGVFGGCSSLKTIIFKSGGSGRTIGSGSLTGLPNLEKVVIGEGITTVDSGAFSGNGSIKEIEIPDGVTTLGSGVFGGCSSLKNIILGSGISYIQGSTFNGVPNLETIILRDGGTNRSTGSGAFTGYSKLKTLYIGEGFTSIGGGSFGSTPELQDIVLPKTVASISSGSFGSTTANVYLYAGTTFDNTASWALSNAGNQIKKYRTLNIDDNVEHGEIKATVAGAPEALTMHGNYIVPGATVRLSGIGDSGYRAASFSVTDRNGDPVELNNNTFVMPDEDGWTITGTFEVAPKKHNNGGSSGDTGATTPTDTPAQQETTTPEQGTAAGSTATESVEATATVKDGKATVEVKADDVTKAIEKVEGEKAENKEVVLEIKGTSGVNTVEAGIPAQAVKELAKAEVGTTINTEGGSVTIPSEAMGNIAAQTGSSDLTVTMENKSANEAAAAAGGTENLAKGAGVSSEALANANIVEVNMTAGNKAITSFGGSNIELYIPLKGNFVAGHSYLGASVSANGSIQGFIAECLKVANQLFAKVRTGHLTTFVVTTEEVKNPFTDVKSGDYFFQPVLWAVSKEVTGGVSETSFAPNAGCTRAQMVTFLWRAAGKPWASANRHFSDVAEGAYYKDAIEWAIAAGITNGISDELFNPDGAVTREQLASFIYRYAQSKGQGFTGAWMFLLDYSDASAISAWADEAMHWCVMQEIVGGTGNGKLSPQGTATRGQIVTMLYRYFNL